MDGACAHATYGLTHGLCLGISAHQKVKPTTKSVHHNENIENEERRRNAKKDGKRRRARETARRVNARNHHAMVVSARKDRNDGLRKTTFQPRIVHAQR